MIRILYTYIFLGYITVFSQEKAELLIFDAIELVEVLPSLEKQFGVQFSYVNKIVANKVISLKTKSNTSLSQLLASLERLTSLKFEITADTYVIIRKHTKNDLIKVCGYIRDEHQLPMKDISVFFKSLRTQIYTDENGYFEQNDVPFGSPILLSAPGFRQKVLHADDAFVTSSCASIFLMHYQQEVLDPVFIQEYITKGITKNKNAIKIDLNRLEILPGHIEPDILQSLQLTPGINSPFETASGIFVRGGAPHQNLVLWNGIKTYHQGHLFGMFSAFNPYATKEVNFYKNGVSAKYGDRIAGVIDISSENEVAKKNKGSFGLNMIHTDAVVHTPIIKDKISLQLSARRSYTDLIETPTYMQYASRVFQNTKITESVPLTQEQNDFFYADYNANLILKPTDHNLLTLNTIYNKNDLAFSRSNSTTSLTDDLITENEGYHLDWKHGDSSSFITELSTYYTKYLLNYQYITTSSGQTSDIESKKNSITDYGASLDIEKKIKTNQKILAGYHYSYKNIKYAFETATPSYQLILDQDDRFLNTHSIYSEYQIDTPKNFSLSAGLRLNHYSELNRSLVEPRLTVQKYITKNWNINISGEYRSQDVSQIQESVVSDLSLENQVWTLANNQQFPLLTSYQATIGSSYQKRKWFLDIDAYYKQIDNITTLTAGFINPIDNNYRQGESTVFGVDLFLKKQFQNYKTWASYSYINTRNIFQNINNNDPFPGNWNIEHTIKWSHFYTLQRFQFSLGWLWHTGKAFTNVSNIDDSGAVTIIDFGPLNGNNLPIYHRLDFSAIYDFKRPKNTAVYYRLGVSILNLYNRRNLLNREFRTTNTLDNKFISSDIYSLGITPNISFRVYW